MIVAAIVIAIFIFSTFTTERHGRKTGISVASILTVPAIFLGMYAAVEYGTKCAAPMVGAFETMADTISPTSDPDSGVLSAEEKQLAELMAAITDEQ
jgi:hypothetical protein